MSLSDFSICRALECPDKERRVRQACRHSRRIVREEIQFSVDRSCSVFCSLSKSRPSRRKEPSFPSSSSWDWLCLCPPGRRRWGHSDFLSPHHRLYQTLLSPDERKIPKLDACNQYTYFILADSIIFLYITPILQNAYFYGKCIWIYNWISCSRLSYRNNYYHCISLQMKKFITHKNLHLYEY